MIHASWPSRILQISVLGAGTSVAAFFIGTKHCEIIDPLDPQSEPLFTSGWYKLYNPKNNNPLADACVRKVPLRLIKYDLLLDAKNGGPKLVEAFTQGCFGGHNFTIQRTVHKNGLSKEECERVLPALPTVDSPSTSGLGSGLESSSPSSQSPSQSLTSRLSSLLWPFSSFSSPSLSPSSSAPSTPETGAVTAPSTSVSAPAHLWTQSQLLNSHYTPGTIVSNHFVVVSHTPTSILVRCGSSPFDSPSAPRASDGLFELSVVPDFDRGFAEFRMTAVLFNGAADNWPQHKTPMPPSLKWLHQQYMKLWMENAVRNCRMSKFRSQRSQVEIAKEKMAKEQAEAK